MLTGRCLCGAVRYRIDGALSEMHHCHCVMCRRAHGAPFSTFADCAASNFEWTAGAAHVRSHRSSEQVERTFCDTCGSRLTFRFAPMPERVWIAPGSLDGDPGIRPSAHIFVASRAAWDEISDDQPRFDAYPPADG
jgi:hypothetical protein